MAPCDHSHQIGEMCACDVAGEAAPVRVKCVQYHAGNRAQQTETFVIPIGACERIRAGLEKGSPLEKSLAHAYHRALVEGRRTVSLHTSLSVTTYFAGIVNERLAPGGESVIDHLVDPATDERVK